MKAYHLRVNSFWPAMAGADPARRYSIAALMLASVVACGGGSSEKQLKGYGDTCLASSECESNQCCNGRCASAIGGCKRGIGSACTSAGECTGGYCCGGVCSSGTCVQAASSAKSNGSVCSTGSECAGGYCCNSICGSASCSKSNGSVCATGSECIGGYCCNGACSSASCEYCGKGSVPCGTGICAANATCTADYKCACPSGYQYQACDGSPCNGDWTVKCPGSNMKCVQAASSAKSNGSVCSTGSECAGGYCCNSTCASANCSKSNGSVCATGSECTGGYCCNGACSSASCEYCGKGSVPCGTGICAANATCTADYKCACPSGYQYQACDGSPCNGDWTVKCPGSNMKCVKTTSAGTGGASGGGAGGSSGSSTIGVCISVLSYYTNETSCCAGETEAFCKAAGNVLSWTPNTNSNSAAVCPQNKFPSCTYGICCYGTM